MTRTKDRILDTTAELFRWRPATSLLGAATALYTLAFFVHNADHVRRGFDETTNHVVWALAFAIAAVLAVRRRQARTA